MRESEFFTFIRFWISCVIVFMFFFNCNLHNYIFFWPTNPNQICVWQYQLRRRCLIPFSTICSHPGALLLIVLWIGPINNSRRQCFICSSSNSRSSNFCNNNITNNSKIVWRYYLLPRWLSFPQVNFVWKTPPQKQQQSNFCVSCFVLVQSLCRHLWTHFAVLVVLQTHSSHLHTSTQTWIDSYAPADLDFVTQNCALYKTFMSFYTWQLTTL